MLSLQQIKKQNIEIAEKAAKADKEPYVIYNKAELNQFPSFPFPNIGDYRPDNWELKEKLFCDKSGINDSGPSMGLNQLKRELQKYIEKNNTYGFAIIESGEFQLYIGIFQKIS